MEQTEELYTILNLMDRPAFCVKDETICYANAAARQLLIRKDEPILPLLQTGKQEYANFQDGCLYLTLTLPGGVRGASITRTTGGDLFVLDQGDAQADLQAMALAAQELRQPLTGILTVADRLFPLDGADSDPNTQEQVARINRGLFQMLRIVSNMSDAYRYSQETGANQETRDIGALFDEIFQNAAPLIQHTQITLHYTGLGESLLCLADEEKLERAVNNILSNAVKFTPAGGTIDARLTRKGHMLYLTVQDSGEGISEPVKGNLYTRFQRSPGIEDSRYGIGLGTVLIRSAAACHGGTVLMEPMPGQGNRITMTMAIRQSKDGMVRSPRLRTDYAGERDHRLIELSEVLPPALYRKEQKY